MKILLVEDVRAVAALMAARLVGFGHEVQIAANGAIAVEMFGDTAPDLVLMDIEMPVMNGFEATNRIRAIEATQQWAWTPIIFLTASDTVENLLTAIDAGGDDFMAKSVPEPVLQAKMKALARIAALRRELSVANRRLLDLASRDGLTGLCNRRTMDQRVNQAWYDAERKGGAFGLLMLDIDNFKKYNDLYGHLEGDECLREVARAIDGAVADIAGTDPERQVFAARYGGEEFAVIVPGASEEDFRRLGERIVEAVLQCAIPHERNGDWGIATVSVGGIRVAPASGEVVDVFRLADERLYAAKAAGRNCVRLD